MARYIDADKLEKEIRMEASESIADAVVRILDRQPTADVVEVVRCVDCRRAIGKHPFFDERVCPILGLSVPEDFYCKYGERKETDG